MRSLGWWFVAVVLVVSTGRAALAEDPALVPDDRAQAAVDAYRAVQVAYNSRNADAYFAGWDDPICFYNKAGMTRQELRSKREPLNLTLTFSIEPLSVQEDEVLLWDTGTYRKGTSPTKPFNKVVLMKKNGGTWRISAEGGTKYKCIASLLGRIPAEARARIVAATEQGAEERARLEAQATSDIQASLREANVAEGSKLRISLRWSNLNDLDIWVYTPSGERIFWDHKHSRDGGVLDVDFNVDKYNSSAVKPVESVSWSGEPPAGIYRVYVNFFRDRGGANPSEF